MRRVAASWLPAWVVASACDINLDHLDVFDRWDSRDVDGGCAASKEMDQVCFEVIGLGDGGEW